LVGQSEPYGKVPTIYETNEAFGNAIGWPAKTDTAEQVANKIGSLTVGGLEATGTDLEVAQSWVNRYTWAIARDPNNLVAVNRLQFMKRAVELLTGGS
jgi:hypothetical protein